MCFELGGSNHHTLSELMTCRPLWMSVLSGKPLRTTMHRWGAESGSAVRRSHTPGPTRLQDAVRKKFEAHGVQNFHRDVPRSLQRARARLLSRCPASTATASSHLQVDRLVHHASGSSAEIVAELVGDLAANPQHLTIVPVDLNWGGGPPYQRSTRGRTHSPTRTWVSIDRGMRAASRLQQARPRAEASFYRLYCSSMPAFYGVSSPFPTAPAPTTHTCRRARRRSARPSSGSTH